VGGGVGLGVIAGALTAPYWLAPFLIKFTNRQRAPDWTQVSEAEWRAANPRAGLWLAADLAFGALGFERSGFVFQRDQPKNFTTFAAPYVNRAEETRGLWFTIAPTAPVRVTAPPPSSSFVTRFRDGGFVETSNSAHVNVFPRVAGRDVLQFDTVSDVRTLHALHSRRLASAARTARELPDPGAEIAFLAAAVEDTYRTHVATGYLRYDSAERCYWPTWKGAFLMTWKLLPPTSWMIVAARRKRVVQFLDAPPS
jgi:hypothetical protein